MKPLAFEDLARLPLVESYQSSFRNATGVALRVVPPQGAWQHHGAGCSENPFCALLAGIPTGCGFCRETEERARRNAAKKLNTQQLYCYAGLTVVAAPVIL